MTVNMGGCKAVIPDNRGRKQGHEKGQLCDRGVPE
jgi:hypothetical protein